MKKYLLLIPTLLLTSCKEVTYPFYLNDQYYNEGKLIELTSIDEFKTLENNKESFGIYVFLPGCMTCASFKPILEEYIEMNKITLYSIPYTKLKNSNNTLKSNINYAPSVALFNEGEIVTYLDALDNEHINYYESVEGFSSWFETYVYLK